MSTKKSVISEELAINEIHEFLTKFMKNPTSKDKVKEEYPGVVEYMCAGRLAFDEAKKPTLTLQYPIKNDEDVVSISQIEFRTRIKPTTKADLADGLNLQTQAAKFSLRLIAYTIGQPVAILDKLEMEDYDVVSELSAVFMAGGR